MIQQKLETGAVNTALKRTSIELENASLVLLLPAAVGSFSFAAIQQPQSNSRRLASSCGEI